MSCVVGNNDRCGRCHVRHGGNSHLCPVHGTVSNGCCGYPRSLNWDPDQTLTMPEHGWGCNRAEWHFVYGVGPVRNTPDYAGETYATPHHSLRVQKAGWAAEASAR